MAGRDGRIRSRDLGTDQANRRVIAPGSLWPEHFPPETVRWLREGLLADAAGALRSYHVADGETIVVIASRTAPTPQPGGPLWLDLSVS